MNESFVQQFHYSCHSARSARECSSCRETLTWESYRSFRRRTARLMRRLWPKSEADRCTPTLTHEVGCIPADLRLGPAFVCSSGVVLVSRAHSACWCGQLWKAIFASRSQGLVVASWVPEKISKRSTWTRARMLWSQLHSRCRPNWADTTRSG